MTRNLVLSLEVEALADDDLASKTNLDSRSAAVSALAA